MANERIIPSESTPSVVTTKIFVEGNEIPKTIEVLNIVIVKEVNCIPFARISIKDGDPSTEDFPASNNEIFAPGKEMEIMVGFEAQDETLFNGILTKQVLKIRQDGTSMLRLECRDKVYKSALGTKNKYFIEKKDGEAIEEIMSEYNLDVVVGDTQIPHKELVQFETSDWDFVKDRARAVGNFCFIDDGKFECKVPDFSVEPVLTLTYGATVLEFDGEMDSSEQFSSIKAKSWDYTNQELFEAEASEPTVASSGNISATDLASGNGSPILELRHNGFVEQDELQAWADGELLRMRIAKTRGRIKFQGHPGIKPGDLVTLMGFGDRFNGDVFVSGIRHEIQGGTWNTDAQFGLVDDWFSSINIKQPSFAQGLLHGIAGLHVGIVSQLQDDPDGENRILVKIPTLDATGEGIWSRISMMDAGENRGAFFLPEVGDEVILGFIHGDPRDAVVLGMFNSSTKPAPIEASDDNFEKGIVTKSEMKILFNDETKVLSMETPAGKKLSLDEDQGILQLEDENNNKIVLDSSGITIESSGDLILKAGSNLQVEGGANAEIKAGANFKAEGSSGAEVSTSAVAVLKGSLVQIN